MHKVCQDMHKYHNYHAILHKLYMWFGKNELRLYLNRAKKFLIGGGPRGPPLNTPMATHMRCGMVLLQMFWFRLWNKFENLSIFDEVKVYEDDIQKVCQFLDHPVQS